MQDLTATEHNDVERIYAEIKSANDTTNQRLTDWLTSIGVLIAIFGIGTALFTVFTSNRTAADSARKWMEENADKLLATFSTDLEAAKHDALHHMQTVVTDTEDSAKKHRELLETLGAAVMTRDTVPKDLGQKVEQLADATKDIPERRFGASEWAARAFAAFYAADYPTAARAFANAAAASDVSTSDRAMYLLDQGLSLSQARLYFEATQAFERQALEFQHSADPAVLTYVAASLVGKGWVATKLDRNDIALQAYDQAITLIGDPHSPLMRDNIARAMVGRGIALCGLDRFADALKAYDEAILYLSAGDDSGNQEQLALAQSNRSWVLAKLGRVQEAISAYDAVILRFQAATDPGIRETVARTLNNKGWELLSLRRTADAIITFDEVSTLFSADTASGVREQVARALNGKAEGLTRQGDFAAAASTYESVVLRFQDDPTPSIQVQASNALVNRGFSLNSAYQFGDALEVLIDAFNRFQGRTEPLIAADAARALYGQGLVLNSLEKDEESLDRFVRVIEEFGKQSNPGPVVLETVAASMVEKAFQLTLLRRFDEALAAYHAVNQRFSSTAVEFIHIQLVRNTINLAWALAVLGRFDESLKACDDALADTDDLEESVKGRLYVVAVHAKGTTLMLAGQPNEANRLFDEIMAKFMDKEDKFVREQVAATAGDKGELFGRSNRYLESLNVYDTALDLCNRWFGVNGVSRARAFATFGRCVTLAKMGEVAEARNRLATFRAANHDSVDRVIRALARRAVEFAAIPQDSWQYPQLDWLLSAS